LLIVGLQGSPRLGGNCDILLDAALESAIEAGASVEKVQLGRLDAKACQACDRCWQTGECVVQDGMQRVHRLLREADGIILCSPIWFSGMSSHAKLAIDRCQCLWAESDRLGKPIGGGKKRYGGFIAVGGDEEAIFKNAVSEARAFFTAIDVEVKGELLFPGVPGRGAIRSHPTAIADAKALGTTIVSALVRA